MIARNDDPAVVASVEGVMSGDPVIVGTRVPAETIVSYVKAGHSVADILDDYPTISMDGIAAVIEWHHARGSDELWQWPAGQEIAAWSIKTSVNFQVAKALLGVHSFSTMVALVHGDFDLAGETRDGVFFAPRRNVMKLRKRIEALPRLVVSDGLDLVGSPSVEFSLAGERRHWSALVDVDDGTPAYFERLARLTSVGASESFYPRWEADSAFTPPNAEKLSLEALIHWDEYARRWDAFTDKNPKVAIARMMQDISESDQHISFPYGWEHAIRSWVDQGMPDPYPFYNRNGIDLGRLRQQMAKAVAQAGNGWVYDVGKNGVELQWRTDSIADLLLAGVIDEDDLPERRHARPITKDPLE